MDRNIVWEKDVRDARKEAEPEGPLRAPSGAPPVTNPDSRAERLLKFIPGEAIGTYLFLETTIRAGAPKAPGEESILSAAEARGWLWVALGVGLIFNWLYLKLIWKVKRLSQILISCAALVVYVFAAGGPFAAYEWYKPLYGTFALGVAAAFLLFAPEPPGPPVVSGQGG
jgi:hypothetical protein